MTFKGFTATPVPMGSVAASELRLGGRGEQSPAPPGPQTAAGLVLQTRLPREDRALQRPVAGALLVTLWGQNHSCTDWYRGTDLPQQLSPELGGGGSLGPS